MNVVAEPTSAGGSVTLKFKQSTIDTSSYLGYMTFSPLTDRFFTLDFTNSNISGTASSGAVYFSSIVLNSNCNTDRAGSTTSYFTGYLSTSSLPSPYTANSLASTDTKKILYRTIQTVSSTYTVQITATSSATPTGITVTRASFGN
ncbi:MAG TPA: hypothetical protein PK453_16380 [Leptospiraceae bacterium]|nr:hypothetical protein [Leptospiraceae bacterium]